MIKKFLTSQKCDLMLVDPNNHHLNATKYSFQTFKNHFISALSMTDAVPPSNYGLNSQHKYKTHWTCYDLPDKTQQNLPSRPSMVRNMIGTFTPSHLRDVKRSFMSTLINEHPILTTLPMQPLLHARRARIPDLRISPTTVSPTLHITQPLTRATHPRAC